MRYLIIRKTANGHSSVYASMVKDAIDMACKRRDYWTLSVMVIDLIDHRIVFEW